MPYLQLDVPNHYSLEVKRDLAQKMGNLYARIMQTTADNVDVGIREFGEGSVWRCSNGVPEPTAVILLDIRQGRPPEQRGNLAQALVEACAEALNLRPDEFTVEFTQHTGDESYRMVFLNNAYHGGFSPNWSPDEEKNKSWRDSISKIQDI